MPIGGFVITARAHECADVVAMLESLTGIEVHGSDAQGNIVTVIESPTSESMEESVKQIELLENVLNVGAVYLHAEDEVEKIERGEIIPEHPFKKRKFRLA